MSERKINNGGPAFPVVPDDFRDCAGLVGSGYGGMTLRDAAAFAALPAIISAACAGLHTPGGGVCGGENEYRIAFDAYRMADAMLRAREAGND